MNLKEKQNLFKLLIEGLRLVNQAGTALVVFVILALISTVLPLLLLHLNISPILVKLTISFLSSFLLILLWRVLAAKADNFGESISNSLTASLIPSVYLLIVSLIIGGFTILASFVLIPLLKYTGNIGLILFALVFYFLFVRLSFVPPALALREQGPVKAIIYSWEMTRGVKNFFRTFFALLVCGLLSPLFLLIIIRALYIFIPLYFADSFNLAALTTSWYVAGGIILFCFLVVNFWSFATFLLFFLNCDYGENRSSYTPLPEDELTSQTTQVFGENNNVLPPGLGKIVTQQDIENVTVKKASVKTVSDSDDLKEHLDKVYQPKPEEFVHYQEEDRMPTILFDDEMAKQIEQNSQLFAKKEKREEHNQEDKDDGQSIKMSK